MKHLSGWALPVTLAVLGAILIIIGSLDFDDEPGASLPPIRPSGTGIAQASPTVAETDEPSTSPTASSSPRPPTPTPVPESVTATQLEVPSVGVNVVVRQSTDAGTDDFPDPDAAYILRGSSQPGRNTNSYIFAHALESLFKPLWNVQLGAEVLVQMSDGQVLTYVVTEVRPNVACPDPDPPNPELNPTDLPLALEIAEDCSDGILWTQATDHERLTLQTSQGYNRNWGELVIVAKPAG